MPFSFEDGGIADKGGINIKRVNIPDRCTM
jgi:hypothetical protein